MDSELLVRSFSTDYHNDLRAKIKHEELAHIINAMSPFSSQSAFMNAKLELKNVQQNDPRLTNLLVDLCEIQFCSRLMQNRITCDGCEYLIFCTFTIH